MLHSLLRFDICLSWRPDNSIHLSFVAASMYRLHNASEHGSGVTNMYSISNAASRAATPLQIGGSDHLVLLTSKCSRAFYYFKTNQQYKRAIFILCLMTFSCHDLVVLPRLLHFLLHLSVLYTQGIMRIKDVWKCEKSKDFRPFWKLFGPFWTSKSMPVRKYKVPLIFTGDSFPAINGL